MPGLLELDRELFIFVNNRLSTHLLDQVMPILTDLHQQPIFWLLLASLLVISIFKPVRTRNANTPLLDRDVRKFRVQKWAKGLVILALSMGLSDLIAYRAVKIWVQRDRPEAAGVSTILRTHSHSGFSFPSNHAANNFALARTAQILVPGYAVAAYAFASVIAFSRVYVGVHYPLDVAGGGLIGFICASVVHLLVIFATRTFSRRTRRSR